MRADAPLFHSAAAAVAWAYETVSRVPVKSCAVYAMRGQRHASKPGLTPDEAHAQASMILSLVERTLRAEELAYVRARFGRQLEALVPLRTMVLHSWGTGVHSVRAAEKALLMYMGERISMRSFRIDLATTEKGAADLKAHAFDMLDRLHRRCIGRLDEALREGGVVGDQS